MKNAINEGNIYKYLTKPWDNDLLHKIVEDALQAYSNQNKSKDTIKREAKEEVKRLQNEFLSNMSHEIRTPLTTITGFAQILCSDFIDPNSPENKNFLQHILENSQNLSRLLINILDLAESANMEFNPKPTDLIKLVYEVKDTLKKDISRKKINVEIKVDPSLTTVISDLEHLKKILFHYLSNAIKFSHDKGTVEVTIQPEGKDHFRIDVKDHGIGIHSDQIKNLFMPFKQLDMSTTKKYSGAGLGLVIVKRIVEAQSGKVGVESALGKGSTFYVILPLLHG